MTKRIGMFNKKFSINNKKPPPQAHQPIYHLADGFVVNHHPPIHPSAMSGMPGMHSHGIPHPHPHALPYPQPSPQSHSQPPLQQQQKQQLQQSRSHMKPGRGSTNYTPRAPSGNRGRGVPIKQIVEYSDVSSEDLSAPEAGEIESEFSSFSDEDGRHERKPKTKNSQSKKNKISASKSGAGAGSVSKEVPKNNNNNNNEKEVQHSKSGKSEGGETGAEKKGIILEGVEDIEDDEDELNQIINNDTIDGRDEDMLADSDSEYMSARKRKKDSRVRESSQSDRDIRPKKRSKRSKRNKKTKKRKKKRSRSASTIESISDNPLEGEEEEADCLTPPLVTHNYEKSYTPSKDNNFSQGNCCTSFCIGLGQFFIFYFENLFVNFLYCFVWC